MTYILSDEKRSWKSYFDYIVVDACKPRYFGTGTPLRQVNDNNSGLKIGSPIGPLEKHSIYSGGKGLF